MPKVGYKLLKISLDAIQHELHCERIDDVRPRQAELRCSGQENQRLTEQCVRLSHQKALAEERAIQEAAACEKVRGCGGVVLALAFRSLDAEVQRALASKEACG